ncbi:MAG TPA: hypothetical protein VJJ73_00870, partial [Candidatus Paceibacterota bacterium]
YDRTPWNFMFRRGDGLSGVANDVAFIDNGASVFSRARGGYKGFPDRFDIAQLQVILSNPQFPGQPVNEAYDNFVKIKNGKIHILDKMFMRDLLMNFRRVVEDSNIDTFVTQAQYLEGQRSVDDAEALIGELEQELARLPKGSSDYIKTQDAIETYRQVMEAGGEAPYLKKALRQRSDDIVKMFQEALGSYYV